MAGGVKFDGGKARWDLMPSRPMDELARVFTIGAIKYGERNWEKGIKWGKIFAAMMRHAWAWWGGEIYDPVDGQHHLASVAWGALVLMEYEQTHAALDDRAPFKRRKYMTCRTCKWFKRVDSAGGDCTVGTDRGEDPVQVNPDDSYSCWEAADGEK